MNFYTSRICKLIISALLVISINTSVKAQPAAPGDIVFTGYHASGPSTTTDQFVFLSLVTIPNGTVIKFTDHGWNSVTSAFANIGNESNITYTNTTGSTILAGKEIVIILGPPSTATFTNATSAGTVVVTGTISLPTSGDQIFAYKGTDPDNVPSVFFGAIHMNVQLTGDCGAGSAATNATDWDAQVCLGGTNQSMKPLSLTTGATAFWSPVEWDDGKFNGCGLDLSTPAAVRAAVNNPANWTFENGSGGNPAVNASWYPTTWSGCAFLAAAPCTVALSSAAGTDAQTKCINTAIINITYATTGATGATFAGLPAGVTGNWATNVVTISGSPTASGTFNYTVTLTGGTCGPANTATGSITVTPNNTITLTSAAGTNNQTVPVNSAITNITYSTTGATGATFSGLPSGVTGNWAGNVVTISGSPTATGTFNYTVTLTGGCGVITAPGSITVNPATCSIILSSAAGTDAQTKCINTPITNITYTTTSATGATFSGLPAGVTGAWAVNVVTISGSPTASGTFNYTVTLTGGVCVAQNATGSITVTPNNTVTLTSAAGTNNQTVTVTAPITNITYATTGATGATFGSLPAGVSGSWSANVATISGAPTATGTFNYTVNLTGGCGTISANGTITVNAAGPATILAAGDIVFTGYHSATAAIDSFSFVLLKAVNPGTVINFTDNAWLIAGGFANTEEVLTLTTNALPAGAEIIIGGPAGLTASWVNYNCAGGITTAGTCSGTAINLTTTGDQVTAFQGPLAAPTSIISMIHMNTYATINFDCANTNATVLDPDCAYVVGNGNFSKLPTGLTIGTNAIWIGDATLASPAGEYDNAKFTGCLLNLSTPALVRAAVNNQANWTTSNTNPPGFTLPSGCNFLGICPTPCFVTRTSVVGTDAQTVCNNSPIVNITYSNAAGQGTTGSTVTGLPAGVTSAWAADVTTISGSPTVAGTFNYTVTLVGGACAGVNNSGAISVNNVTGGTVGSDQTIPSGGDPAAFTQSVASTGTGTLTYQWQSSITNCISDFGNIGAATAITYDAPAGLTQTTYYRRVTTSTLNAVPCTANSTCITVTVSPCSAVLSSVVGTNAQTVCINTAITNITYTTTGATGATFGGLPAGVTGAWAANVVTISGTPTASGTFNYTVTLTGGPCTTETVSGTITVSANNTVTLTSAPTTNNQTITLTAPITNITYTTTGATGAGFAGLPAGVSGNWAANVVTISGTPTATGTFNYTVTLTGGCAVVTATGVITVNAGPPATTLAAGDIAFTGYHSATAFVDSFSFVLLKPVGAGTVINFTDNGWLIGGVFANTEEVLTLTTIALPAGAEIIIGGPAGLTASWTNYNCVGGSTSAGTVSGTAINLTTTGDQITAYQGPLAAPTSIISMIHMNTYSTLNAECGNTNSTVLDPDCAYFVGNGNFSKLPTGLTIGTNAIWIGDPAIAPYEYDNAKFNGCGLDLSTATAVRAAVNNPANWITNNTNPPGFTLPAGCFFLNLCSPCVLTLTSAAGTNAQTICNGSAITNITYSNTSAQGATGATFSGLPAGVTGAWAGDVVTISGTPTASGTFNYTVTLVGGTCAGISAAGTITVSPNNTITLTSAAGTNAQTVCINTAITNITYSTTGATGATFSGLPAAVTGNWAANVVTISGTPTASGTFNFTVTLTGGCGTVTANGSITVTPNNTITLTSAAGTNAQTLCINTAVTNITYSTTGATGATFSGLPAGVTGGWAANVVTISGTPTASGTFNYTVTLTGGCGAITANGSIVVTPNNTITLTSAAGTNAQTKCINTAITNITYSTTGATGATFSGLPAGVTGNWAANVVTISGTPTASGTFNYTVTLTGGCGSITAGGSITVNPNNTITLTSAAGTNAQTVLINTPITNITYATTGATGATFAGLPAGVTGNWAANVVTISGTPTVTGTFNYTVTLTGGCGTITATGTITVFNCSITRTSAAGTDAQSVCNNSPITNITYATAGATGATFTGLPAGVTGNWAANVATISGTPTATGVFNYTVTLTGGGCGAFSASGTITVNPNPVVSIIPPGPTTICAGNNLTLTASATCTTVAFSGLLSGAAEVPANASTARGLFSGTYNSTTNQLSLNIVFNGLTGGNASAGHVHSGVPGVAGPVIIPFPGFPAATSGTYTNTFTMPPAEIANFMAGNTYINIHNAVFPGGEIRGQIVNLVANGYTISGPISGTQSVPPTGSAATGNFAGTYNDVSDQLRINVIFNNLTGGNASAAHIHTGAVGVNGAVIIPFVGFPAATSGSYSLVTAMPAAQLAGFLAGNTYVNIHNAIYPGGEIRGQIAPPAAICGSNTYLWSPGGATTKSITVSAANTYTVTVTDGNSCSGTASVVVNLNPVPVGSATAQTICSGATSSVTLSATTPAGGTTYSYTAAIQTTPTGGTITGQGSGTANPIAQTLTNTGTTFGVIRYTVTPNYTNGGTTCPGTAFTVDVTVNPTPVGSATAQTICSAGTTSVALSSTTPAAGTTYTWTAAIQTTPTGGTITGFSNCAAACGATIAQTLTNTGTTFGVIRYTVTPFYTNAGQTCPGAAFTVDVTVNPTPVGSATAQTICNGGTTSVALTSTSPAAGTTYSYTAAILITPTGGTITGQGSGTANPIAQTLTNTGTTPGVIRYTVTASYTNAGLTCTGATFTVDVTVNPTPVASINPAGPVTICTGSSVTLTASATCNNLAFSGLLSGTNSVPANASTARGVFNGTYNSATNQLTLTVVFNGLTGGNASAAHIHSGSAAVNGPVIIPFAGFPAATSGTYTNTFTVPVAEVANFLAGNTYINIHNAVFPGGEIRSQITNLVSNVYTLSGAISGAQSVPANASTATGNYAGTYNNNTGQLSLNLIFNNLTGGNASAAHIHSATPVANGPVIIPFGGFPAATSGSYSIVSAVPAAEIANFLAGNTYINIHNAVFPGGEIRGQIAAPAAVCTGTTYLWSPGGATTAAITVSAANTYSVVATSNGCNSAPASVVVNLNPIPVGSATAQTICSAGTTSVALSSTTPAAGTTYTWTAAIQTTPTGGTITGFSNCAAACGSTIAQTLTNTGTTFGVIRYTVTPFYTNGGTTCPGTAFTVDVTVNPTPVGSATAQTICSAGTTSVALSSTTPAAGTTYTWTAAIQTTPTGGTITGFSNCAAACGATIAQTLTNTGTTFGVIRYTVTPFYTNAGQTCPGTAFTVDVTVNPTPVGSATAQTICSAATTSVALSSTTPAAGTTYTWTAAIQTTPTGGTITGFSNCAAACGSTIAQTLTNTGTSPGVVRYTVTPFYTNAGQTCPGATFTVDVTVNPVSTVTAVPSQVICNGSPTTAVTFSSPTTGGTIVYNWTNNTPSINLAASGTGNIASFTATNLTTAPVTATITVTPSYTNGGVTCVGTPSTFTITVNPTATVTAVADQVICNGSPTAAVNFTSPTTGGTIVYNWTNNTTSINLAASGTGNIASFTATNTTTAPVTATITVTPSYTNGGVTCVGTPSTFTITVNPTATVDPVANQVLCNGSSTAPVLFSSPTTGGTIVYNWTNNTPSIGLAASGAGDIGAFAATNTGTAPVTATITVTPTYTNGGTSCVGTAISFTITVNPTATVTVPANAIVCNGAVQAGGTYNFSTTATGGTTTYAWVNNNIAIGLGSGGTGNSLPAFTAANAGNAPISGTITVTPSYTNGGVTCVGTPSTFTITVNPTAIVNPVSNQVVCNGSPTAAVNFTSPTTGGTIVYSWTNNTSSIGLGASGTGNIASFTAANTTNAPVVATITVTATYTNGVTCVGTPTSFTITVNPTPVVNAVASQTVCNNSPTANINFSSPTLGGAQQFNWTNNTPSIGIPAAGTGDILSFNAINGGNAPVVATITVTMSYINGGVTCTSAPVSFTITVNPTPQVNQPANQTVCAGAVTAAVNFTSPSTGGTLVYNWTNNQPSIGLAATGTGNIGGFTAVNAGAVPVTASITVTPVYTNGGTTCTGPSKTFTITVNPVPTVNAVSNKAYCNGATTAIINFSGTAGGTAYNWTNNNTAIGLGASGTGDILPFTTTNGTNGPLVATITVTPVAAGCPGAPVTFTITVNPTPVVNPIASQTVCNGTTTANINFISPTTGPTGALSFSWTNSQPSIGLAASGNSGSIAPFTAVNAGSAPVTANITVTPVYNNGGVTCSGTPQTFTIVVNPTPTVSPVANQTLCAGSATAAVNFTGFVPGTIYNWTNSNPAIGLAASGAGNIASFTTLNATNVAQVATITVTPNFSNGPITCPGTPTTFTITVNPIPSVNAVANQTVCAGATVTQAFSGPVAGTVYSWTNSNTAIGLGASGTGNLNFVSTNTTGAPLTGTVTVTPTYTNAGASCTGASASFTITVNPVPTVNPVIGQILCNGSATAAVNFTGAVPGTVYSWTNSNPSIGLGASGAGNIGSFTATNATTVVQTATITVTPSFTSNATTCTGAPISFTIVVNPTPSVNTIANQTVCAGATTTAVTISGPVAGTVYNWTNSNPSIGLGASGSNTIPAFTAINAGNVPVTATITVTPVFTNGGISCPGATSTFTITVNPTANVNQPADQVLCNGSGTAAVNFVGTVAATTYSWTNSNPAIGLAASGTGNIASFTATNGTAAPITAIITVTPSSPIACTGTPVSFTITVNPTPTVNVIADQTICAGSTTAAVTVAGPVAGASYSWTNSNTTIGLGASGIGNIPAFVTVNPTILPVTATITVTATYTNGGITCTGPTRSFTITVNPQPNIIFTNVPPRVCLTDTVVLLTATPAGGTWTGPGVSGNSFTGSVAGIGVQLVTYTIPGAFGCTATRSMNIVVNDCLERHNVFQEAIRIMPNPSNGEFKVQFNSDKYKEFKVKVADGQGREMAAYEFKNLVYGSMLSFNLKQLAGGTYYLYVYNTQESGVFPIVIAH
jgi:hypothetical protein